MDYTPLNSPDNFEEKQYLEKPAAKQEGYWTKQVFIKDEEGKTVPKMDNGFPVWEAEIKCSTSNCGSKLTVEAPRSDNPSDPTVYWFNELAHARCHDCLDNHIVNMLDEDNEQLITSEWPGYEGNKFNKCCCDPCLKSHPGRRFISADERMLTKLWKDKGLSDEEITKRLAKRKDKSRDVFKWERDPNKTEAENLESWRSQQDEQYEQMILDKQESDKMISENPMMQGSGFLKKKEEKKWIS